jgi:hypothetical protein
MLVSTEVHQSTVCGCAIDALSSGASLHGLSAIDMTPHIEKNLAQEVLGKRLIADEAKKPAVDVGPMPGEQSLHRWFAASGDLFNQDLV